MLSKIRDFSLEKANSPLGPYSRFLHRFRWKIRRLLWQIPLLYHWIYPERQTKNMDYDLFLEGFPRSGNTYLARLFHLQYPHLKIHSHSHVPPKTFWIIQSKKPLLWIIRDPLFCVPSWTIYTGLDLAEVLQGYIDCYSILLKMKDSISISTFDEVVENPSKVVQKLNQKFNLNLETFTISDGLKEECFEFINSLYTNEKGQVDEMRVARPSEERAKLVLELQVILKEPRFSKQLTEAQNLFQKFSSFA